MTTSVWHGIHVATTLPFTADLSVDYDGYAEHVAWLADQGMDGVVPNGSLGFRFGEAGKGKWNLDLGDVDPLLSLYDVPEGPGHAWDVVESQEVGYSGSGAEEALDAVLPAWSASTEHVLDGAEGVPEAFATLETFLRPQARPGRFA